MPTLHYLHPDGSRTTVEAKPGTSVMQAAIGNNVRGIDAECGGSCSCATCHVIVDPAFASLLDAPDEMEAELLEGVAAGREPTSRLGCQVALTARLDGLTVRIPARQS
jgi:2Fe-2S ferredoxin